MKQELSDLLKESLEEEEKMDPMDEQPEDEPKPDEEDDDMSDDDATADDAEADDESSLPSPHPESARAAAITAAVIIPKRFCTLAP
jgi:hypothetical protein